MYDNKPPTKLLPLPGRQAKNPSPGPTAHTLVRTPNTRFVKNRDRPEDFLIHISKQTVNYWESTLKKEAIKSILKKADLRSRTKLQNPNYFCYRDKK